MMNLLRCVLNIHTRRVIINSVCIRTHAHPSASTYTTYHVTCHAHHMQASIIELRIMELLNVLLSFCGSLLLLATVLWLLATAYLYLERRKCTHIPSPKMSRYLHADVLNRFYSFLLWPRDLECLGTVLIMIRFDRDQPFRGTSKINIIMMLGRRGVVAVTFT